MLPEVSRYKQIKTEAGEPLDAYQNLFDRVAKTYDAAEQATTGYQMFMANLKGVAGDEPLLKKHKEEIDKSISNIAKEAAETGRYDIASNKTKDLGIKILTDPTLKHIQEFYASAKPDMDIMNSADKALYIGGKNLNNLQSVNPDGTFNTYKSDIEKRMDWNKSADEAIERIKGTLSQKIEKMSPEQQAALGIEGGMLNFIQTESLQNKDLADKMDAVMNFAVNDPALNQFGRFNGGLGEGGKGLDSIKKLIADRFSTGTYKIDKSDWRSVTGFNPTTTTKKEESVGTSLQSNSFDGVVDPIGVGAFKKFNTNPDYYKPKEQKKVLSKYDIESVPEDPKIQQAFDKDKEKLLLLQQLNPKLKGKALHEVADDYNKNTQFYEDSHKAKFGSSNIIESFGDKVVPDSGFDKIAQGIALNSKNVLIENGNPKDKGKTLGDQLEDAGIDVADLDGANKKIVGLKIDTTSDDENYNGGIVTQITTKDGKNTFRVVSYNQTYKNMFKGYADVKKDLIKIGNTEDQKNQLTNGKVLTSSWKPIASNHTARATKHIDRKTGEFITKVIVREKLSDKDWVEKTYDNIEEFDNKYKSMLMSDSYFTSNFK